MTALANKLWGFCHTLRHDGVDYGDYVEQLSYLLFFKMSEERGIDLPPIKDFKTETGKKIENQPVSWNALKEESGTDLTYLYGEMLRHLRKQKGDVGDMFFQAMP